VSLFLTFLIAAIVLAITPGPGLAYVVARTVAGGRKEGLASCFGTAIGGMVHVAATALGISVLIAQSALAFSVIKYLGSAYLVYLGIKLLRAGASRSQSDSLKAQGPKRAFLEGILVEIFNVKTALFFLAFIPQFIAPTQAAAPQLLLLGSLCVALNTAVDVAAVFAAHRLLQSQSRQYHRARLLNYLSGITLLILGAYLGLTQR
jgi:threonine/homoserine/homoserine lactone efflux protein